MEQLQGRLKQNEKGSFTIEASLIMPIIFIIMIIFIFLSIVVFEKVKLYYMANQTAERIAFTWNNSFSDPITGDFNLGENDGLYWRLTDDRIFDRFFSSMNNYQPVEIKLGENLKSNDITEKKLSKMDMFIPKGINGDITYINNLAERKITVKIESTLKLPKFTEAILDNRVSVSTSSTIADPVEFIRTIDLISTYANKFNNNKSSIKDILQKQGSKAKNKK